MRALLIQMVNLKKVSNPFRNCYFFPMICLVVFLMALVQCSVHNPKVARTIGSFPITKCDI